MLKKSFQSMGILPRVYLIFFLFIPFRVLSANVDTSQIKAVYDRCLELDESKTDSLCIYAKWIEVESKKLQFVKGPVLSLRIYGLCHEMKSEYQKAIDYYLQSLEQAQLLPEKSYEVSALSDLAIVYSKIQQPVMAKKFYLQCADLALQSSEIYTVVTSFNNLGVIYNQLGEYDSALYFLNRALSIVRRENARMDYSSTINNIGNAYFKKKDYAKALEYFQQNYRAHQAPESDPSDLWTDHINLADTYISIKKYDSAEWHLAQAKTLNDHLQSKSKEADQYSLYAKLYESKGSYAKAYDYLSKWYQLDTSIVNGNTQSTIAELQERYNARQRENENKLLLSTIEKEQLRTRNLTIISVALAIIGALVAAAFIIKRRSNERLKQTNELILRQNERLAELNAEKNSLISIVSHDLASPFSAIQMWNQVLEADKNNLTEDQAKAVNRIQQSSAHGQQLIRNILDIEKHHINQNRMQLETFDLGQLLKSIVDNYSQQAERKQIQSTLLQPSEQVIILNDRQLVQRIFENLYSNAIKYTPAGGKAWMELEDEDEQVIVRVCDEGVGIEKEELPHLFEKYSRISSRPTGDESSTGLGLSIVKRIVDELNGQISCESEPGQGSVFTVKLKK